MSKAERTRQRILDAASAMVHDRGIAGFRVDELVADLGLTRQTFYRYYSSKDEILQAVIVENGKLLAHAVFEELMSRRLSFREFLVEGVIISVDMVKSDPKLQKVLNEGVESTIAAMVSNFDTIEAEMFPILKPYIISAQEQGIVRANVSTEEVIRWVFRTFLSEMVLGELDDIETRRSYLIKMMTPAILVEDENGHSGLGPAS